MASARSPEPGLPDADAPTPGPARLTHVDEGGRAAMVEVGAKPVTRREARASGRIRLSAETLRRIRENALAKGDVLAVARIAGIQAAKETARLVPLCHPLALDHVELSFELRDEPPAVHVSARTRATARTGVEMEALTAVAVALLAVYDMVKAVDRGAEIGQVRLDEKSGGKSGEWRRGRSAHADSA
jgi:cyclic pyranopterin phosphate synthase